MTMRDPLLAQVSGSQGTHRSSRARVTPEGPTKANRKEQLMCEKHGCPVKEAPTRVDQWKRNHEPQPGPMLPFQQSRAGTA